MKGTVGASLLAAALAAATLGAQTRVTPPANKYSPAEDVRLGREAAQQVRKELPLLKDDGVESYVEGLGRRLVQAIEPSMQHAEFQYTFEVVNLREINAFALPGGPMFLHRGMLEAAKTEGEAVSVMAHELSHVILRHGTAQASKATPYQIGQVAGAVLGAIIGGRTGNIVAQGTQFGLGAAFLRYSRDYERQADILGAQLMARAGYDPRDMAAMFQTIEKEAGSNGPEWLSSHPNPGNRSEYITKEARLLEVTKPVRQTGDFERIRTRLKNMPKAPSMEEVSRSNAANTSRDQPRQAAGTLGPVEPPSSRLQQYSEGNLFRIAVPSNWREFPASSAVTFAPEGGFGDHGGANVLTHGVEVGLADSRQSDLRAATDAFLESLSRGNPQLSRPSGYLNTTVSGRRALQTRLQNVSDATGRPETIEMVTTRTRDGNLFYTLAVAPEEEASAYRAVFTQIVRSIRLTD
ncbi:MAG: M48 family metalloprotease [Vicinamibacterales bacterium]